MERNFRPVSVLNTFSKIYEKFLKQQLNQHLDNTLSVFIEVFRRAYSTQHVFVQHVSYNDLLLRSSKCTMHCSPKTPLHRNTQNTESFESTIDAEHFELRSSNYSLRNANNLPILGLIKLLLGPKALSALGHRFGMAYLMN